MWVILPMTCFHLSWPIPFQLFFVLTGQTMVLVKVWNETGEKKKLVAPQNYEDLIKKAEPNSFDWKQL